jgi:hypothetical protein
MGLWDAEDRTLSRQSALGSQKAVMLWALHASSIHTSWCFWYSRLSEAAAKGHVHSKKLNYLIGTRTPDLPVCSIVPRRTTLEKTKEFGESFPAEGKYISLLHSVQNSFGGAQNTSIHVSAYKTSLSNPPLSSKLFSALHLLYQPITSVSRIGQAQQPPRTLQHCTSFKSRQSKL